MKYCSFLLVATIFYSCNNNQHNTQAIVQKEEVEEGGSKKLKEDDPKEKFAKYKDKPDSTDVEYYKAYNKVLELWKTPFQEINIHTSFGNAHVIITGPENAKPVVLLHGMNASSTMWYPNIIELSKGHRVYAIDFLLEPGKSHMDKEVKDLENILNWYDEIFNGLNLKKFSIIGASRGGWTAINIALRKTSRIEKLILLSPCQSFEWIRPGSRILAGVTYTMKPKRKHLRRFLEIMSTKVENIPQAFIDQLFIATENAENKKFIVEMTPFSEEQLKKLTMPVLLLIGDNDIINNEKSIENAKKMLLNPETEIIRDAGHFLSFDQAEIVNSRMIEFLKAKRPKAALSKK